MSPCVRAISRDTMLANYKIRRTHNTIECDDVSDAHSTALQGADSRGGTSHSDPITTTAQALRPAMILGSPPTMIID